MARGRFEKRTPPTPESPRGARSVGYLTPEDLAASPTGNKALTTSGDGTSLVWASLAGGGPHEHPTSEVTGLDAALAAKVDVSDPRLTDARTPTSHTHGWDAVTDKPSTFSPSAHGHAIADTTGLQGALDGKAAAAHAHDWDSITSKPATFAPTIGSTSTTAVAGDDARLSDARAPLAHTQATSTITGLDAALTARELTANKGQANGYAGLGADGKVPSAQLPAGSSSSINTLRVASPQIVNGTAYRDITGLTFPVSANTDYAFHFYIVFRSTLATGFRFAINGPASATCDFFATYQTIANATTAGVATWLQGHWVTYDAMAATTASIAAGVDLVCMIEGRITTNGTPGTLAARVASESANNDLVIQRGSWGTWF